MYDMSRFPEENPNPVMRVIGQRRITVCQPPRNRNAGGDGVGEGRGLAGGARRSIRGVLEKKSDQEYELPCPRNRVFSLCGFRYCRKGVYQCVRT